MSSFTKNLSITKIKVRKRKFWAFLPWVKDKFKLIDQWRVETSFDYHVGGKDSDEIVHIPAGFICDGSSNPRLLWPIIGHPMQEYAQAAFVHDYLYTSEDRLKSMNLEDPWEVYEYTRQKCDYIFYEAMGVLGVKNVKRMAMYAAVRAAGGCLWRKRGKGVDTPGLQQ